MLFVGSITPSLPCRSDSSKPPFRNYHSSGYEFRKIVFSFLRTLKNSYGTNIPVDILRVLFLRESRGFPLSPSFPSFSPSAMPANYSKHPPEPPSSQFSSSHFSHKTQLPFTSQQALRHRYDEDNKQHEKCGKDGNGSENAGEYVNESMNPQGNKYYNTNDTISGGEIHPS